MKANAARGLGLGPSQTGDPWRVAEVKRLYRERWHSANQEAISAYNARIDSEGLPLAQYRSF